MFQTTRPTRTFADSRPWLTAAVALVVLAGACAAAAAQDSFDIASVPRPDGAEAVPDRASSSSITYVYPASISGTVAATESSLNAGGWLRYRTPDETPTRTSLRFKNARVGIYVSFTMSEGKADRSRISYRHNNSIPTNLSFPADATEIIYDENRPYLRCVTALSVDAVSEFFAKELGAEGWSRLDPGAIEARWPNAKLSGPIENGRRLYFTRQARDRRQEPVMLTLQRSADKTIVDVRIAPFALPQDLALYKEFAGFPSPGHFKSAGGTGSADSIRREATALVIAEVPVVLAFYRREMILRGWQEKAADARIEENAAKVTFTKPDDTAVLELGQRYDLTTVRIVAQVSQAAITERQRAKKEADAKWMRDAMQQAQSLIAESEAKRRAQAAEAERAPVEMLLPLANAAVPIPLPANADDIKFDGNDGKLDFTSLSSPKSVAAFYRDTLQPLGWKERRGVINGPTMFSMDFSKGAQKLDVTVMLFAGKAKVSARGSGLLVPADPNRETERLEAEETSGFPVPKKHTQSGQGTWTSKTGKVAFRRELNAQVPADIGSVLAFYRRELAARQWRELPDGAVVKPEQVLLAFAAPDGPAWLKLGREGKETTINIAVKNPAEAEKAGIMPLPGKARVILGNFAETEGSVTIDGRTFRVAVEPRKSDKPTGPILDLKPGKYRYVLKFTGKQKDAGELSIGPNDTWALLIGPGGILQMHMY